MSRDADFKAAISASFAYYRYKPSFAAAILFASLFAIATIVHLAQLIRGRTWYFIPIVVGGCFELAGYIGRAISSNQTPYWTLGAYIDQALLLLLAPALFAATIYMTLGRIILSVNGEAKSLIRKRWLTKLFVCGDITSFVMQGMGGGIMAGKTIEKVHTGEKIILGGLFMQVITFAVFVVVAIVFHRRMAANPTPASHSVPWVRDLTTLYIASSLIMVRSVFRVVEYLQGNDGYILEHEVFLYIFDSVLMLAVMILFNIEHPSNKLGPIFPLRSRKGLAKSEEEGWTEMTAGTTSYQTPKV